MTLEVPSSLMLLWAWLLQKHQEQLVGFDQLQWPVLLYMAYPVTLGTVLHFRFFKALVYYSVGNQFLSAHLCGLTSCFPFNGATNSSLCQKSTGSHPLSLFLSEQNPWPWINSQLPYSMPQAPASSCLHLLTACMEKAALLLTGEDFFLPGLVFTGRSLELFHLSSSRLKP